MDLRKALKHGAQSAGSGREPNRCSKALLEETSDTWWRALLLGLLCGVPADGLKGLAPGPWFHGCRWLPPIAGATRKGCVEDRAVPLLLW